MKSGLFVSKSWKLYPGSLVQARGLLNESDGEPVIVNDLQQARSSNLSMFIIVVQFMSLSIELLGLKW